MFVGSPKGTSTRPPHVIQNPKAEIANCPYRGPQKQILDQKLKGYKSEMELIASILVSTAQEGVSCFEIDRVFTDEPTLVITQISLSNRSLRTS